MTITEFLLARIAEDESVALGAEHAPDRPWEYGQGYGNVWNGHGRSACDLAGPRNGPHIARHDPARVLAECAAKRAIVGLWEGHRGLRDARRSPRARAAEDEKAAQDRRTQEARARVAEDAMFALAAVYASHPDYRQEWAL